MEIKNGIKEFKTEIVDLMPSELKEGILYISQKHAVAIHLCACGCKEKVVTPLDSEHGWTLFLSSNGVSLRPSIGNFSYPCGSHYFIKNNKVRWCE